MPKEKEQVRERLEENGYRLTSQRAVILEIILNEPNRHLSADDLYLKVKEISPEIGLATVYRTLELFRELGIVHQMDFLDGISRYEYSNWEHHHHLVCLRCGKIIEFCHDELEVVEKELAKTYDFEIVGHHMKLVGYCRTCRGESENSKK